MPAPVFVVGDVHGHRDVLVRLLRDAGLVDAGGQWAGADARLWLLGDLVDRGPDGIATIELVMALETASEGRVGCLLGNHDLLLRAVERLADEPAWPDGTTFRGVWLFNGGNVDDLGAIESRHLEWIERRPAVVLEGDDLLVHADTDLYLRYGSTVDEIGRRIGAVLAEGRTDELAALMDVLSDRGAFADPARVDALLDRLGGNRIVHGHTPIAIVAGRDPVSVTEPLVYGGGRVINADHCLFGGGRGFVVEL